MHIAIGTVLRGIALEHSLAQVIDAGRQFDLIALRLHGPEGIEQRLKNRQVGGAADIARIGRKVEHHNRHLALGLLTFPQRHQLADPCGEHDRALGAGAHVLRVVSRGESAGVVAAGAGNPHRAGATAEHNRAGRAVEFGNGHHDGAFDRQQSAL